MSNQETWCLSDQVGPEKRRSAVPARRPSPSEIFCSSFCFTAKWHHARKKFRCFFQDPPDRKDTAWGDYEGI